MAKRDRGKLKWLPVNVTAWHDGVHYVEPIEHELRIITEEGAVKRIKMADVVGVDVVER